MNKNTYKVGDILLDCKQGGCYVVVHQKDKVVGFDYFSSLISSCFNDKLKENKEELKQILSATTESIFLNVDFSKCIKIGNLSEKVLEIMVQLKAENVIDLMKQQV